jgi:putative DNA-invertase from lambdoid prophage Rac
MALVVYVFEESKGVPTHERDLFEIDAAGYFVDMSSVFVECCSCTASMSARPAFQRALRRLQAGDTLVTTELMCLGNSVTDVLGTIELLGRRGIVTVCLAYGRQDLCSADGQSFIDALRLAEDLERVTRRSRAREAANAAKERGVAQGRPSSLTLEQQQQAMESLGAGHTVTEIARTLNTSRQTIMRLRNAHRQTPDEAPHDAAQSEEAPARPLAANDSK